ncbi:hypothetical protein AV530_019614 [Patagioenas fasciata monilis]|uniref:Uncharacterized protein n=1 Tax=Patagioenas fasciata monilis TaxID=372326 RepID=A0A1V4JEM7_PATFA|nr:hypothetical protein AV530_019614 [Patagioenas fasciata monilis]
MSSARRPRPPIGWERVVQSDIGDGGDAEGGIEKPPSAPGGPGHTLPARPAAPGSQPDTASCRDAPCDLCHSPRTKWRDPWSGQFCCGSSTSFPPSCSRQEQSQVVTHGSGQGHQSSL